MQEGLKKEDRTRRKRVHQIRRIGSLIATQGRVFRSGRIEKLTNNQWEGRI